MSDDTPAAPADVSPGDKVAGYRLEEQIGQGGMAVVYRAHDERLDRRVALKVLAPALAADTAFRTRFIRESRAAAAVDHPNIIPVYDAGDAGGCLFISMRYVQGGDVRSLLRDGQPLPAARAWNIISQVGAALDAAHAHGLIHRDVKPANMLLDASGKTTAARRAETGGEAHEHVYLSDFGISKRTVASNLTSTGQFVGTLDYIAPEQVEGQAIDGRADQYSLACAAYELLCGAPPFRRSLGLALINAHLNEPPPSLVKRRPEFPASVDLVLAKAMAKSPAQRYATCEQFAADLGRALGLVPGALEAGGLPPAGSAADSGGQAKPWPATQLAEPVSGPGGQAAGAQQTPAVAGHPGQWGPAAAGAVGAVAGGAAGAAPFDPSTMLAGQHGAAPGQHGAAPGQHGAAPGQHGAAPGQQSGYGGAQYAGGGQYSGGQYSGGQHGSPGQYAGAQYAGAPYAGGQYGGQQPGGQYGAPQQYQQPAGPTAQDWQHQPPARRSRGLMVGLGVGALVVVVAAGAIAAVVLSKKHTGGGGPGGQSSSSPPSHSASSSPPVPTARSQATAISTLLMTSGTTRGKLEPAVADIENNCAAVSSSQLASDVATIRTVQMQRKSEYSQAFDLQVSALANGSQLKNGLLNALQASLNADTDYLQWARQEQSGCFPASNSTAFNSAGSWDTQAVNAKTSFAGQWNPVAQQYSLPTVTEENI